MSGARARLTLKIFQTAPAWDEDNCAPPSEEGKPELKLVSDQELALLEKEQYCCDSATD